jgi:hypothetical protein
MNDLESKLDDFPGQRRHPFRMKKAGTKFRLSPGMPSSATFVKQHRQSG